MSLVLAILRPTPEACVARAARETQSDVVRHWLHAQRGYWIAVAIRLLEHEKDERFGRRAIERDVSLRIRFLAAAGGDTYMEQRDR